MKIAILGAGIAGITSAYVLAKQGHEVVIVDKAGIAGEASFANGGQLSYNYRTPIANPSVLKQLPKIVLGFEPAFRVYPSSDIGFYRWGLKFLAACSSKQVAVSTKAMLTLGRQTKIELNKILSMGGEPGISFDYQGGAGKLNVYSDTVALEQAAKNNHSKLWSRSKLIQNIPALANNKEVVGALWDEQEDSGDCYKFCCSLMHYLQKNYDVKLLGNHEIIQIEHDTKKITSVCINKQDEQKTINLSADTYVSCLGPQSTNLLKCIDISVPIYPMKGYSVTVPATQHCVDASITDLKNRMVFCKLGGRLRIAGFAEFSGYSTRVKPQRIKDMLTAAKAFMPTIGDYDTVLDQWCGLRPATPDSLPIVGKTKYENLLLNTGHGMLGWSHSLATATLIGGYISNTPQPFDPSPYLANRF